MVGWKWKVERESEGLLDTLAEGAAWTRTGAKRKAERVSSRMRGGSAQRGRANGDR